MGAFARWVFKIILVPLVAFWAFAIIIKFTPFFQSVDTDSLGEDSIYGLVSYYKVFGPVQIVIAILTQWLIVMPLWKKIVAKPKAAITIFVVMLLVCMLAAFGIAYIIWDPLTKYAHLVHIWLFMTGVQVFYWLINFLLLRLISWNEFKKTPAIEDDQDD
jgi:hypothetical protein